MQNSITLFLIILSFFVKAQQIPDKPNPVQYVNDYALVLNQETKIELENNLKNFADKTSNVFVIVTIRTTGGEDISNFSIQWAEKWGIGKRSKNNGILFLVAVQDHKMRIEVGYGNEDKLTDAIASEILNSIKPYFKANDFNNGISSAAYKIISQLDSNFDIDFTKLNQNTNKLSLATELLPPKPTNFEKIIDLDNLLSEREETEINNIIKSISKKKFGIKAILVNDYKKYTKKEKQSTEFDFLYDIKNYWNIIEYEDEVSVLILIQKNFNVYDNRDIIKIYDHSKIYPSSKTRDSLNSVNLELRSFIKQNELKKGIVNTIIKVSDLIKKNRNEFYWEIYTYLIYTILGLAFLILIGIYFAGSGNNSSHSYGTGSSSNYSSYRDSYSDSYSDSSSSYSDFGGGSFGGGGASGDW